MSKTATRIFKQIRKEHESHKREGKSLLHCPHCNPKDYKIK